jgi:5-formyltetrahydrofolate cyclo-ligase
MTLRFVAKDAARQFAWDRLSAEQVAREPFPSQGRIPNFMGARTAALRLFTVAPWRDAQVLKINPDAAQRPVRWLALLRGIRVCVPTPALRGGFWLLDPQRIPAEHYGEAACRTTMTRWAEPVALGALPRFDGIVAGSAAVTAAGKRCGKGAGYSDLEYALLRELGCPPVPVATTVHDLQVLDDFPVEAHDLPLSVIFTPTRTIRVAEPLPVPEPLDWSKFSAAALAAMPVLEAVRALRSRVAPQGQPPAQERSG